MACGEKKSDNKPAQVKYQQSDVRNRNLKTAIEDFNNEFYKAALTSIEEAKGDKLRDEDITLMRELEKDIENKTLQALKSLDSLAVKDQLHLFDFKFNTVNKNYDISAFRPQVEKSKATYLQRVKSENDSHLKNYFSQIESLKEITDQRSEGSAIIYYSKSAPLKLAVKIDGYKAPQIYLYFYPSQLEPELETIKFTSSDISIFYDKSSLIVSDYNISVSRSISYNLLDEESKINLEVLKKMLANGKITIDLKWFYEPERIQLSESGINQMKSVMTSYENMLIEYQANIDNIYVPKHVK
jgi:hypothetical protein